MYVFCFLLKQFLANKLMTERQRYRERERGTKSLKREREREKVHLAIKSFSALYLRAKVKFPIL